MRICDHRSAKKCIDDPYFSACMHNGVKQSVLFIYLSVALLCFSKSGSIPSLSYCCPPFHTASNTSHSGGQRLSTASGLFSFQFELDTEFFHDGLEYGMRAQFL